MIRTIAALLSLVAASGALAQGTIFRCGNAYSQSPCPDGRTIDPAESARTATQRDEALRVAASERKLADEMERDRRRAEAARPTPAVYIGTSKPSGAQPKASAAAKTKKKRKNEPANEDFVAAVPKAKG
jgi:hypothetical protein